MQQYCNTCGAPITAGMTVCARCGTPVSGGAYDPTIRAGSPPNSAYGSQPYGPPPSDPYGAPPPPPPGYGSAPTQGAYGAPTQGGYGTPPPPPGFGPPPQPGFGGPQQPYMAPMPPQKKSRTWIYVVLGIVIVLLLVCGGAAYAISRAVNNAANAVATTVATVNTSIPTSDLHITNVEIGKGDDQGNITTKTSSFTQSDTIDIDYTATTQDSNAQVTLVILDSSGTPLTGGPGPQTLDVGQHDYFFAIQITGADSYTAELQYNGTTESSISFTVS